MTLARPAVPGKCSRKWLLSVSSLMAEDLCCKPSLQTVPVLHRMLQRRSWEFQSRAAVGSSTAELSLLLYHCCEFPLRSLRHCKNCRSASIWITVRLLGTKSVVKQKQNEMSKHAVKEVRKNTPTVFLKLPAPIFMVWFIYLLKYCRNPGLVTQFSSWVYVKLSHPKWSFKPSVTDKRRMK